jgi:aminopeptidase N
VTSRFVLLAGLALAPSLEGQARPLTGASRDGFDVLHYEFHVGIPSRPLTDTLQFVTVATIRRTASGGSIALDLVAAMTVDSVTVNGAPARTARPGQQLEVPLPAGRSDTLTVRVVYHGRPSDGLIIRADSAGSWTAFGDNFPDRARQWLATVDHPGDKATVEWVVRAPATHRVIANGELLEETPVGGEMTLTRWRSTRPLYTAVMVIGVARFGVYELGNTSCGLAELPGCVRQSVWITPDVRSYLPGPFAQAGPIVEWMSRVVGPFPYEKLAHVQSSTRYGGMENASAIFYADAIYKRRSMSEGLIAHEAAHQWFGDAVTTKEWPHVWLSEGFATYFAALWTERSKGDSAFRAELQQMRASVLNARLTRTTPVIDEKLDDLRRLLNSNVYQKAGFVLHMLRREVGDSAFYRGIRAYYGKHRHGHALTADFIREMETASGSRLDWFFEQWMRRPGFAELELKWQWDTRRRVIEVTATQGTTFPPFRVNVSMDVEDARGRVQRVRVTLPPARVATVPVSVNLTGVPAKVTFDPDVSLLGTVVAR